MAQLIAAQTVDRGDVVGYGTEYRGALATIKVDEKNPTLEKNKGNNITTKNFGQLISFPD